MEMYKLYIKIKLNLLKLLGYGFSAGSSNRKMIFKFFVQHTFRLSTNPLKHLFYKMFKSVRK